MADNKQKRPVFFLSDRTGITSETLGHALLTQFNVVEFDYYSLPFITSDQKAHQAVREINQAGAKSGLKPIVFSTMVKDDYKPIIAESDANIIDFFDVFINPLEQELGVESSHTSGLSHGISDEAVYMQRIDAVNYALHNDDGITTLHFDTAEIILIGASRSGKTPTCLYLGLQYAIRAANYPLTDVNVDDLKLPSVLVPYREKLYGLIISPDRLRSIRELRRPGSEYASLQQCQREIRNIKALYDQEGIHYVDTSHVSVEEIAATILQQQKLKRRMLI
ncbi:MAG: kinase/pyrophosphorylase [Gammaproteobacteria bacterium]|nr:kinase/pyrophosphorylase [Gammaproteobacteria bacterium]